MKVDKPSIGFILINRGKILMQLQDNKPGINYPGYWALPGGKVEKGETEIILWGRPKIR